MPQTKLRSTKPFGSPQADDDEQNLYNRAKYCEFPTHLHQRLRLTSDWNSGVGTSCGQLTPPGLLAILTTDVADSGIMIWTSQAPMGPGEWLLIRICDFPADTWRYQLQHFTAGVPDGVWQLTNIVPATTLEICNLSRHTISQLFQIPSRPLVDWMGEFSWWGNLPGHDYPPPASDDYWDQFH